MKDVQVKGLASHIERIASIDFFRSLAAFSVILMHTGPLKGAFSNFFKDRSSSFPEAAIEFSLDHMTGLAPSFFLIIAGYLLRQKISSSELPVKTVQRYFERLVIAWLFWRMIYFLIPPPGSIEFIVEYGYGSYLYSQIQQGFIMFLRSYPNHLWFIPALMLSVSILILLYLLGKEIVVLPLSILLYLISYLATDFSSVLIGGIRINDFLSLHNLGPGYYTSLLFVYGGWVMANRKGIVKRSQAVKLFVVGWIVLFIEVVAIWKLFGRLTVDHGLLIGQAIMSFGVVSYVLSAPNIGVNSFLARWGKYTLGVYMIHYLFFIWLNSIIEYFSLYYDFQPYILDILRPVVIYSLSLLVVIGFSKIRLFKRFVM